MHRSRVALCAWALSIAALGCGAATSGTGASEPPPDECAPQRAGGYGDCDALLDFFVWDGAQCVDAGSGCGCRGEDCGAVYRSADACRQARATCLAR